MVKAVFLTLIICAGIYAQNASEKASEFISNSKLNTSKNLISFLFANTNKYYNVNGEIDVVLILKTLKDNGLLELSSKEPQELELVFVTKQNPLIFMRVISESLNSMGYNLFLTKKISKSIDEFVWRISLSTQNVPSPLLLDSNMKMHGCEILDIKKDGNVWSYVIDSQNAKINAIKVEQNKKTALGKPFAPYILELNDNTKTITLEANPSDYWYPKINFYNENLYLIRTVKSDKRETAMKLRVPQNSVYMKVDDRFILENIKRGLAVTFE
ncbi:MAG: hypothetical protein LBH45_03720 [Campylobacteraceae bacterium]|nr:hypothetical protein [Campylobacteraceae bacterium]